MPIKSKFPSYSCFLWLSFPLYRYVAFNVCRAKSLQSCSTLCDAMDCSQPGSSVHGILQARILEWVTISFSKGSSQPRGQTRSYYVSCIGRWVLYHWRNLGSPITINSFKQRHSIHVSAYIPRFYIERKHYKLYFLICCIKHSRCTHYSKLVIFF